MQGKRKTGGLLQKKMLAKDTVCESEQISDLTEKKFILLISTALKETVIKEVKDSSMLTQL